MNNSCTGEKTSRYGENRGSFANETSRGFVMSGKFGNKRLPIERKIANVNYAEDVNYSMRYTRWFLTFMGIWPYVVSNSTRFEKILAGCLMPLPSLIIALHVMPIITITIVREITPMEFTMLLGPIFYRSSCVVKNIILMSRHRTIKLCVEHMENDWRGIENDRDRQIMLRHLQRSRKYTLICICFQYIGTTFYNSMPFIKPRKIDAFNQTIRPVNIPGIDFYIDLRNGHNYEIVIFTSFVSFYCVSTTVVAIYNLIAVLAFHVCGQIQIVMSRLENLIDNGGPENIDCETFRKELTFVICIHVRALRFASKIDELLHGLCLIKVVDATLMLCLVVYMFMMDQHSTGIISVISYTALLISYNFNIYILCRIGQLLKEKCEAVGKAAYMTEWYKLPGKLGLSLIMIFSMANYPRRLTAGRLIELSLSTYGAIMKTSFGYLNMLRTMTE